MTAYILLFFAIITAVAGQLLLKHGMSMRPNFNMSSVLELPRDPYIMGGVFSYGISTLLYFNVLSKLELSLAYPSISLGYVLVILMSKILFNENVSWVRWTAIFVICFGVFLVGYGAA
jgi:multidrug transporter EmrE-like cation transporter